jgi:tripartite ATP-independent transporter DctM subunit
MSPELLVIIAMILFFVLLFLGLPFAFAMFLVGFGGLCVIASPGAALNSMAMTVYRVFNDYNYTVIPFFILMGELAAVSQISEDLFITAEKWLRRLPGGLAVATVMGCAAFGAICGSAVATSATMGTIALPEMKKNNYADSLATGTVAAAGTLGFLIPPSVGFVVYGILTEQSVGKLLIAGILPGIMLAILWGATIILQVKRNPRLAPMSLEPVSWKEKLGSMKRVWTVVVVFLAVMAGIWLGLVTPTEAGALGGVCLFLIALGKRKLSWKKLFGAMKETASVTIMLLFVFAGALVFSQFLTLTGTPEMLLGGIGGLNVSRYVILLIITIILLILGCIMDVGAMIIITIPILYPIITSLGFDPIWFGVYAVLMMNAGLITPPVGMNVFVTASMAKVPMWTVFRGSNIFLYGLIATCIIITIVPAIATLLPSIMK